MESIISGLTPTLKGQIEADYVTCIMIWTADIINAKILKKISRPEWKNYTTMKHSLHVCHHVWYMLFCMKFAFISAV